MEDCGKCQKEHEYRLKKLDEKALEVDKLIIKVEKVDESVKSAHARLNEIGEQTLAIYKLGVAVEGMTEQIKELAQGNKEHKKEIDDRLIKQEERIDILEKTPGQDAFDLQKQIRNYIVIGIVGAVLGFVFTNLGVK